MSNPKIPIDKSLNNSLVDPTISAKKGIEKHCIITYFYFKKS